MSHFTRLCAALLVALSPAAVPTLADEELPVSNVRVTFEVGVVENGADTVTKSYEMVVGSDGKPASMSTGARIPIPTSRLNVPQEGGSKNVVPISSFTYQQVGFNAEVSARIDDEGHILLRGRVEDSSLTDQPSEEGQPFIQSMEQKLTAKLEPGKPLRINRVDETDVRSFFIQVRADPMDSDSRTMKAKRSR